jgi:hypothetical protein
MKIVLFNDDKKVIMVQENVENPIQMGTRDVVWGDGGIHGIDTNYVILPDEVNFEDVSDEVIQAQFEAQKNWKSERDLLREELAATQAVLNDFLLGGL